MNKDFKQCKQCGELKPQIQFRKYYGGRKGTYNTCKLCEKINSREKYLTSKEAACSMSAVEQDELAKIYKLWKYQVELGLRPPRTTQGKSTPLAESLDEIVDRYAARARATQCVLGTASDAPAELIKWITEPLTEDPEYYQEDVYEELQAKYRPQVKIDQTTMLPVYDDTYRAVLQEILGRFDAYEDEYYND